MRVSGILFPSDNFRMFTTETGLVNNGGIINLRCPYLITNTAFNGGGRIDMWGNINNIQNSEFTNVSLRGNLSSYKNKLRISSSVFKWSDVGVQSEGFELNRVSFEGGSLGASFLTVSSSIRNCTFKESDVQYVGLSHGSGATTSFTGTKITNTGFGTIGVLTSGGSVNIKCGAITGHNDGIIMEDDAVLNLSNHFGAGNLDLSDNGYSINAERAGNIFLDEGYNGFWYGTDVSLLCSKNIYCWPSIVGTLTSYSCGNRTLYANRNDWSPGNRSDERPVTELRTTDGCGINVIDQNPVQGVSCTFRGTATGAEQPQRPLRQGRNPYVDCPQCEIISTPDFRNVRLDRAIRAVVESMDEEKIPAIDYKRAVGLFSQILEYPNPSPNQDEKYLREIAYKKMYEAFSGSIERKQIETGMSPELRQVLQVQDARLAANQIYDEEFYTRMDRAHVYRLSEQRDLALQFYDEAFNFAEGEDKEFVERWRCYVNLENQMLAEVFPKEELYDRMEQQCPPPKKRNRNLQRRGVAEEESSDDEEVLSVAENLRNVSGFSYYPNPAQDYLNVQLSLPSAGTEYAIEVYSSMGQKVISVPVASEDLKLDIHALPAGVYYISVTEEGTQVKTGKFLVTR
jgi:tetratricopeptide (TPR) repeat protein